MGICATKFVREASGMSVPACEDTSDTCSEGQSDPGITKELGHPSGPITLGVGSGCNTLSLLTLCDAIVGGRVVASNAITVAGFAMSTPSGWWEDNGPTGYNFIQNQCLATVIDDHVATLEAHCAPLEEEWQHLQELGARGVLAEWKKSQKHIDLERLRMEIDWLTTARKSLDC